MTLQNFAAGGEKFHRQICGWDNVFVKQGSPYTVIRARDHGVDFFFFLLQGSSEDHARVVQATSLIACHTVIVIVNGKVSGCDLSSQKSITVSKGSQVHKVDEAAVTHGPGLTERW
jgi:hypothetical protein